MAFNPDIHHRKSIRLKGYDYSKPGLYFVTVCTFKKEHLFGEINNKKNVLNKFGKIVMAEWFKTVEIRSNILLDEFVIMPNHIHGIIHIIDDSVGAYSDTPLQNKPSQSMDSNTPILLKSPSKTLGAIVRGFKSAATKQINKYRHSPGIPVWQRNFYERIIKDEKEFYRIKTYIRHNPLKWADDRYYQ